MVVFKIVVRKGGRTIVKKGNFSSLASARAAIRRMGFIKRGKVDKVSILKVSRSNILLPAKASVIRKL